MRSLSNYYPYGSLISAGSWSDSSYNYGYNGMLKEGIGDDISHTHFRNLSVGDFVSWWSPDPLEFMFPDVSPYLSMGGNPINFVDPFGLSQRNPNDVDPSELPEPDSDGYMEFEGSTFYRNPDGNWVYAARGETKDANSVPSTPTTPNDHEISEYDILYELPVIGNLQLSYEANSRGEYHIGLYYALKANLDLFSVGGSYILLKTVDIASDLTEVSLDAYNRLNQEKKFEPFRSDKFRTNLKILTGENPPSHIQAHHVFPQKYREVFLMRWGINIDDPKYGAWWESPEHQRKTTEINDRWDEFFDTNPNINQILLEGRRQANKYGFKINY